MASETGDRMGEVLRGHLVYHNIVKAVQYAADKLNTAQAEGAAS